MERLDLAILRETHPRASSLDGPAADRDQQGFDIAPSYRPGHRLSKYGRQDPTMLAVHASKLAVACGKCNHVWAARSRMGGVIAAIPAGLQGVTAMRRARHVVQGWIMAGEKRMTTYTLHIDAYTPATFPMAWLAR